MIKERLADYLFHYYRAFKDELVEKYGGKYLCISKDLSITPFDKARDAFDFAKKTYGWGNCVVQFCAEDESRAWCAQTSGTDELSGEVMEGVINDTMRYALWHR